MPKSEKSEKSGSLNTRKMQWVKMAQVAVAKKMQWLKMAVPLELLERRQRVWRFHSCPQFLLVRAWHFHPRSQIPLV